MMNRGGHRISARGRRARFFRNKTQEKRYKTQEKEQKSRKKVKNYQSSRLRGGVVPLPPPPPLWPPLMINTYKTFYEQKKLRQGVNSRGGSKGGGGHGG